MNVVVANYRTGSTTLAKSLGGKGNEYLSRADPLSNRKIRIPDSKITVYKVMPDHWGYDKHWHDFKLLYLNPAKEIHICLRENFNEQVNSFIFSSLTNEWEPSIVNPLLYPISTEEVTDRIIKYYTKIAVTNLEWQSKVYKEFDTKLHWLEDRFDETVKYTRRYSLNLPELSLGINVRDYF